MEEEESQRVVPFQLQFDKLIASQVILFLFCPHTTLFILTHHEGERVVFERDVSASVGFICKNEFMLIRQVKIAEWNPEKDLLAMVTEDSKLLLHRFNWQRLWTISPGNKQYPHFYPCTEPYAYTNTR